MQVMLPSVKQCMMKYLDYVTPPLITNGRYNFSGDKSNMYQSMAGIITHPHRISRSCNASVCGQTISAATLGASTIRITHQSSPHHHLIHPPTHARTHSRPSGQGRLLMWSKPTTSGVCPDARTEQPRRLASQPNHRRSWSHVNSSRRLLPSKLKKIPVPYFLRTL